MQFGLFCSPKADAQGFGPETGKGYFDFLDFNVEAEALGFHSSFVVEHHFSGWNQLSVAPDAADGARHAHQDARLGTAVMVPTWHNPLLLAEQAATLDLMSNGRLDLGIGKGYRHSEFNGFAIPQDEAEERFEEALALMLRAWGSRERFTHHGRFWSCNDAIVEPPPAQSPHPPLWVAAGNAHSIGRAGERGFNLILDQYAGPAVLAERIAVYKAAREKAGLAFDPAQVAVARLAYVANDKADQRRRAQALQAKYTAQRGFGLARPANRQGPSLTCSPMPTAPAPPKSTRCSARPRSCAPWSAICATPACAICC